VAARLKLRVSLTRLTSGQRRWCAAPRRLLGSAHLTCSPVRTESPLLENLRSITDRALPSSSHTTLALAGCREIASYSGVWRTSRSLEVNLAAVLCVLGFGVVLLPAVERGLMLRGLMEVNVLCDTPLLAIGS
jgi:hypothetical protein